MIQETGEDAHNSVKSAGDLVPVSRDHGTLIEHEAKPGRAFAGSESRVVGVSVSSFILARSSLRRTKWRSCISVGTAVALAGLHFQINRDHDPNLRHNDYPSTSMLLVLWWRFGVRMLHDGSDVRAAVGNLNLELGYPDSGRLLTLQKYTSLNPACCKGEISDDNEAIGRNSG